MESLQAGLEHRAIDLAEQTPCDMHQAGRVDAEKVAVEGEVVNGAESKPVDDRGDAGGFSVRDDVGGLNERPLPERADLRSGAGTPASRRA
jgi:hypothetical protein